MATIGLMRTNTNCNVPQQENTEDCGIFVCLYCKFILNDCALDFTQDDIRNGEWCKKMVLSILSIDGPEGRSLYCLNLNCRAPPGRFLQLDLTGWWRDV